MHFMKLVFLNLFLLFAVLISVGGDIFSKLWALDKKAVTFGLAPLLYTISSILWLFWIPYVRLAIAVTWWQSFAVLLTIAMAIFYFKEKVTSVEILAIALIIAGVVILNLKQA